MALRRSCHPTQLAPPPAARAAAQLSTLPVARAAAQLSALPVARAAAQLSALPVAQQCTQMPRNGSERPFSAICVHYCVPTGRSRNPRVATVYTNGLERLREADFGDLCTLLRPPASPPAARATPVSQQCTQMAQNSSVRPFSAICVHYCVPLRHHGPPARASRRNSVHNHEAPNIPAPGRRTSPRSG